MDVNITLHDTVVGDFDSFTRNIIKLNDGLVDDVICYPDEQDETYIHVIISFNDKMVNRKKLLSGNVVVEFPFSDRNIQINLDSL